MREKITVMTFILTTVMALFVVVNLNPALTPAQASVQGNHVILLLPWEKTSTDSFTYTKLQNNVLYTKSVNTTVHSVEVSGSMTSRSGQPFSQPKVESKPTYSEEDLYWMARVISSEAKGESLEGKIAVGAVVMNRLQDSRFPKTVKDVIFAKGQFDPAQSGIIHQSPNEQSIEAAKRALNGENPVPGALYFYNPAIATDKWVRDLRVIKQVGNHVFAAK